MYNKIKSFLKRIKPTTKRRIATNVWEVNRNIDRLSDSIQRQLIIFTTIMQKCNGGGGATYCINNEDYPKYDCGPIFFYLPYANKEYIQQEILLNDDFYSIRELKEFDKYFSNNMSIIDIGANIGNHSIYFAKIKQAKRIYAFEPQKDIFGILNKNIALNQLNDIIISNNTALGRHSASASISSFNYKNMGGTSIKEDSNGDMNLTSLDILDKGGYFTEKIDFMKIDVEGFEKEVLLGSKSFFSNHNPVLLIEIMEHRFKEVNSILENELSYRMSSRIGWDYIYTNKKLL